MEKSLVYEVNIDIEVELTKKFEAWLLPHIEEVLATGAFLRAHTFKRDGAHDGFSGYTIQYFTRSEKALEQYLADRAPVLRRDAEILFGSHFKAFRRVLREF